MRIWKAMTLMVGLAAAPMAQAEPLPLDVLSDYMTGLSEVQTTFTQVNSDGTVSSGLFQLKRPGKMRFEYDPPDHALVVAGAGAVAIIDKKLETFEQYALRRTPLKLILDREVDLSRDGVVVGHYETRDGLTVVTAQDPAAPERGTIDLVFTADPVTLSQWRVRDETGGETLVLLDAFDTDVDLPLRLFNLGVILDDYR